jgi:hypothetical protein
VFTAYLHWDLEKPDRKFAHNLTTVWFRVTRSRKCYNICRMCFSIAFVSQLQLWHLHWLVLVESVGDLISKATLSRSCCNRETYDDIGQNSAVRISPLVAIFIVCVYSMITALLCTVSWVHLDRSFTVVKKEATQKCVTLLGQRRLSGKVNVSGQMFIKFSIPLIL